MGTRFNHLNVPSHWQHYWSKYPEGYTILEALLNWVKQVDDMVDSQNNLSDTVANYRKELDDFISRFDPKLQTQVTNVLSEWQSNGFLDIVIDEALQTEMDNLDTKVTDNLNTFDKDLQKNKNKIKITGTSLSTLDAPKQGIVSFITDDGQIEDYTVIKPIFERVGVPCNAAIITNDIGNAAKFKMTLAQLKELQDDYGWEIQSHTMGHVHLDQLSEAQQEAELKGSVDQLNSLGLKCESIAYPFGHYNDITRRLTRKYYRSGRTTDKGRHGINYSPIDTYELKMIYLDSSASYGNDESGFEANTLEFYKYYIDKNQETNGWLIITFHGGDIANAGLAGLLEQVVNYANSKSPIMTYSDALDRVGNIVDIGDKSELKPTNKHFTVGYDGKISTNNVDVLFSNEGFDGNTPLKSFQPYRTTMNLLSNTVGQNIGMPDNWGGILYTHKVTDDRSPNLFYNYQLYHVLITNNVYKRSANNDGTWGKWFKVNPSMFINTEGHTPDTNINEFDNGISINSVNSATAQTTSAPVGLGGTLLTFKTGYNWQEYHVYNSQDVYKRVISGSTPGAWKKISSEMIMPYDQLTQLTTSTSIQSFPLGVSYNTISAIIGSQIGTPENAGGTLMTTKVHQTLHGYNFQQFHIYGLGAVYTRSFGSDGSPTAWVKL